MLVRRVLFFAVLWADGHFILKDKLHAADLSCAQRLVLLASYEM